MSGSSGSKRITLETHAGVDFVGHIELLAGVQNDWGNGRVMSMAHPRKQMVHDLQVRHLWSMQICLPNFAKQIMNSF